MTAVVEQIIAGIVQLLPLILQNAATMVQPMRNIIVALQTSGAATPNQLSALATLDAQLDAAFEAAAKAAGD